MLNIQPFNVAEVLGVCPKASNFTCVAETQQGSRCRNTPNANDREKACEIVYKLSQSDERYQEKLDKRLKALAHCTLCRRWHQKRLPQEEVVARKWRAILEREASQRVSSLDSSVVPARQATAPEREQHQGRMRKRHPSHISTETADEELVDGQPRSSSRANSRTTQPPQPLLEGISQHILYRPVMANTPAANDPQEQTGEISYPWRPVLVEAESGRSISLTDSDSTGRSDTSSSHPTRGTATENRASSHQTESSSLTLEAPTWSFANASLEDEVATQHLLLSNNHDESSNVEDLSVAESTQRPPEEPLQQRDEGTETRSRLEEDILSSGETSQEDLEREPATASLSDAVDRPDSSSRPRSNLAPTDPTTVQAGASSDVFRKQFEQAQALLVQRIRQGKERQKRDEKEREEREKAGKNACCPHQHVKRRSCQEQEDCVICLLPLLADNQEERIEREGREQGREDDTDLSTSSPASPKLEELVWCHSTCGQNAHKACWDAWEAEQLRCLRGRKCAFCRSDWWTGTCSVCDKPQHRENHQKDKEKNTAVDKLRNDRYARRDGLAFHDSHPLRPRNPNTLPYPSRTSEASSETSLFQSQPDRHILDRTSSNNVSSPRRNIPTPRFTSSLIHPRRGHTSPSSARTRQTNSDADRTRTSIYRMRQETLEALRRDALVYDSEHRYNSNTWQVTGRDWYDSESHT